MNENMYVNIFLPFCISLPLLFMLRELVEELHPLMKEALERRPEVRLNEISCFYMMLLGILELLYYVHIISSLSSEE